MRKAYIIECPKCGAHRVNRKKKRCIACGQKLLYRGDYWCPGDDAYHWLHNLGWVHVRDLKTGPLSQKLTSFADKNPV